MEEIRNVKRNIMQRVRTIYMVRVLSNAAVAVLAFAVCLYALSKFVFVAQVYRNMPAIQDGSAVFLFFIQAFVHTDISVQLAILGIAGSLVWMAHGVRRLTRVRVVYPVR